MADEISIDLGQVKDKVQEYNKLYLNDVWHSMLLCAGIGLMLCGIGGVALRLVGVAMCATMIYLIHTNKG